jgi:hypothetical protein
MISKRASIWWLKGTRLINRFLLISVLRQHSAQLDLFDPSNKCGFLFIKMMLKQDPKNFNPRLRQAILLINQHEPQEALVKIMPKLAEYVTMQLTEQLPDIKTNPGYHLPEWPIPTDKDQLTSQVAKTLPALIAEYQRHLEVQRGLTLLGLPYIKRCA